MESVVKAIGYTIVTTLLILAGAFTLSTMWAWFVVPLGVTAIGMAHATGLSLFVSYFRFKGKNTTKDKQEYGEKVAQAIATMLFVLGVGYICTLFM